MPSRASELAYEVRDAAASEIQLVVRPFNRFDLDPQANDWWLVPSTEWPAYKYGKLFFNTKLPMATASADSIFCGFYAEKGLGSAAEATHDRRHIIGDDWLWKEFVHSAERILPDLPSERGFVSMQAFADRLHVYDVSFSVQGDGGLTRENENYDHAGAQIEEYFRRAILPATDVPQLFASLSELPEGDFNFIWLDLCIGIVVSSQSHGQSLWSQYLRRWRPWLRSAITSGT